jgi:hypothetical protein
MVSYDALKVLQAKGLRSLAPDTMNITAGFVGCDISFTAATQDMVSFPGCQ